MKILVTGGAGFLGSHLVDYLLNQYAHEVIVLDDLSGGFRENVNPNAKFIAGSINDAELVDWAMEDTDIVFHLAAYAAEGLSHFIKRFNYENNLIGSINLINAAINNGVKRFVFTSCHDDKTRVFTKDGLKYFNEINQNDLVLTLNTDTENIEWQKIDEIVIQDYIGKLYGFKSKRNNILVTPNHRILFKTKRKHLLYQLAEKTLKRKAFFMIPYTGNWKGKDEIMFKLNTHTSEKDYCCKKGEPTLIPTEDLFYLIGLFIADGVTECQYQKTMTKVSAEEKASFRDEFGRFKKIDLPRTRESTCKCIRTRFCVPKADKARQKLLSVLERNGYEYTFNDNNDDGGIVRTGSHGLHNIFKQCGDNAHNKHIPEWMLEYAPKYLNELYNGLIDGDGHTVRNSSILTTVSERLVENCIELGAKIGKATTFRKYKTEVSIKGRKIKSTGFRFYFTKTQISSHPKNNYIKEYNGKVWCLKVKNGNFLVEREGRSCFSGNSMAVYGTNQTPFNEDTIPHPEDSYGIAKYAVEQELKISKEMFGLDYTIIRPHNIYGIRQNLGDPYRNVIGIFMNRIMQGKPPRIYGNGDQTRAFSYIDDIIPCLAKVPFTEGTKSQIINLGAAQPTTINRLAEIVLKAMRSKLKPVHTEPRYEVRHAYCTTKKSEELLGFKSTVTLEEGIQRMADWARKVGARKSKVWEKYEVEKNIPNFWRDFG